MSTIENIKLTLSKYINNHIKPIILHCVSDYPCSDKSLNLYALDLLKDNFLTIK